MIYNIYLNIQLFISYGFFYTTLCMNEIKLVSYFLHGTQINALIH